MVYGNSNSNDDVDGQWTMDIDMVIFLLSTWRSIFNNSSDNNISSINAKRLDLFILLEDCNGALSLVVMGDQDHVFLGAAQKFARVHKNVDLTVLDKCGHICNIENHLIFNERALAFLKE